MFKKFLERYAPEENLIKPSNSILEYYSKKLPKELIDFWREYGFGNYGNGIIKVINPLNYSNNLYQWLGKEDIFKIPIMISGFGEMFYYRKLSETDDDVCMLDIYYRKIEVCSYSFKEFVNDFIIDDDIKENYLRTSLFEEGITKLGSLKDNEIFFFAPTLSLGGAENIKYVDKGDAITHQQLLFSIR